MSQQAEPGNKFYEIRLLTSNGKRRVFATLAESDKDAADYGKSLLIRHVDCEGAEVWCGMKLIRQL